MTLTRGVEHDRAERALTSALISFAADIGATIVAEGIETEAELTALFGIGVRHGQGYHLGRPAPLDATQTRPGDRVRGGTDSVAAGTAASR